MIIKINKAFESRESAHFFMILIAYFMYIPTFFIIQIWLGG